MVNAKRQKELKALGYDKGSIAKKFIVYALFASRRIEKY